MKDYEKKYKEALERAKKYRLKEDLIITQDIFPELKESEDERMIKSMTRLVKAFYDVNFPTLEGFTKEDMLAWLEKQGEQKPAWSEEDDNTLLDTINILRSCGRCSTDRKLWLLSLKDRVGCEVNCTTTKEWSEVDEERLQSCLNILQAKGLMGVTETINSKWLKSLKDRCFKQWKPTKEQMGSLLYFSNQSPVLAGLYEDLKKLKAL